MRAVMKQTEIMFFFDTEDFTSNRSADAIKGLADICTQEGVTGHFAVVGLLAKQLRNWGRDDVIESLKPHIIGTHTYGHSLHPDICEQSDFEDFSLAYNTVAEYEDRAIEYINEVLNPKRIMFACPPGNSKSYAAMYYYADRGIPFYCDTIIANSRNSPLFYCNQEHIAYTCSLESMFLNDDNEFDEVAFFDDISRDKDRVILYTHPNMSVKTEFWDKLNYNKGNLREFGNWIEAPNRTQAQTDAFWAKIRRLIRFIKNDSRFKITCLNEVLAGRAERVKVTHPMLRKIKESLKEDFASLKDPSLSISDVFCACVNFLRGGTEYVPDKAYGFLLKPFEIETPCRVTRVEIIKAAEKIDISGFLPEKIPVGEKALGPADFLFAALEILTGNENEITLLPRAQLNDISHLPELCSFKLKGTWVHTPELEDNYLSKRVRLQCWTLR